VVRILRGISFSVQCAVGAAGYLRGVMHRVSADLQAKTAIPRQRLQALTAPSAQGGLRGGATSEADATIRLMQISMCLLNNVTSTVARGINRRKETMPLCRFLTHHPCGSSSPNHSSNIMDSMESASYVGGYLPEGGIPLCRYPVPYGKTPPR